MAKAGPGHTVIAGQNNPGILVKAGQNNPGILFKAGQEQEVTDKAGQEQEVTDKAGQKVSWTSERARRCPGRRSGPGQHWCHGSGPGQHWCHGSGQGVPSWCRESRVYPAGVGRAVYTRVVRARVLHPGYTWSSRCSCPSVHHLPLMLRCLGGRSWARVAQRGWAGKPGG